MAVAISAIAAAAAAVGTEAFVGLAITAVADTGMALSVVGAVTGNKSLTKVGAAMSLAGGVGMAANSMFGAAADVAGDAAMNGVGNVDNYAVQQGADASLTDGYTSADAATGSANGAAGTSAATDAPVTSTPVAANDVTGTALAQQSGQVLGGTPTVTGAGGNVDPATGLQASAPGGAAPATSAPASSATPADPSSPSGPSSPGASGGLNGVGNVDNYAAQQGASPSLGDGYTSSGSAIVNGTRASGIASALGDMWTNLGPAAKAEILKAALAVPGGIQAQQNKARELALQAQKVQQTSYGTQVPNFTTVNGARS